MTCICCLRLPIYKYLRLKIIDSAKNLIITNVILCFIKLLFIIYHDITIVCFIYFPIIINLYQHILCLFLADLASIRINLSLSAWTYFCSRIKKGICPYFGFSCNKLPNLLKTESFGCMRVTFKSGLINDMLLIFGLV